MNFQKIYDYLYSNIICEKEITEFSNERFKIICTRHGDYRLPQDLNELHFIVLSMTQMLACVLNIYEKGKPSSMNCVSLHQVCERLTHYFGLNKEFIRKFINSSVKFIYIIEELCDPHTLRQPSRQLCNPFMRLGQNSRKTYAPVLEWFSSKMGRNHHQPMQSLNMMNMDYNNNYNNYNYNNNRFASQRYNNRSRNFNSEFNGNNANWNENGNCNNFSSRGQYRGASCRNYSYNSNSNNYSHNNHNFDRSNCAYQRYSSGFERHNDESKSRSVDNAPRQRF